MNQPYIIELENQPHGFRRGWYLIEYEVYPLDCPAASPALFSRIAGDTGWQYRIPLEPCTRDGLRKSRLIRLDVDAERLVFRPTDDDGAAIVPKLSLRRLSRARALLEMSHHTLMAQPGIAGKWYWSISMLLLLVKQGPAAMAKKMYEQLRSTPCKPVACQDYRHWLELHDHFDPEIVRRDIACWPARPRISILIRTEGSSPEYVEEFTRKLQTQIYPPCEVRLDTQLLDAVGDFIAYVKPEDALHPTALYQIARHFVINPHWRVLYTDDDRIDEDGILSDPCFKPDWNHDLFLSQNYISGLVVYEKKLLLEIAGSGNQPDWTCSFDIALHAIERLESRQIGHIPEVLYHRHHLPARQATNTFSIDKQDARVLERHFQRLHVHAEIEPLPTGGLRIRYALPDPPPKVSLIIPTRNRLELLSGCVESIIAVTDYPDYELVIVDNQSDDPATLDYLARLVDDLPNVRVLHHDAPFNYSAINNYAARVADGKVLGLVNNDVEFHDPGWLREMVSHACRDGIGAVGCLLVYPDGTRQHAGIITGLNGVAAHIGTGRPRNDTGYFGRGQSAQNLSAVTAACMLVTKTVFDEVGGLDERLAVDFNDVDLCLRLRHAGYRNVWTPHAWACHHESASRGIDLPPEQRLRSQREIAFMEQRWGNSLRYDPAYNRNLALKGHAFRLKFPFPE